MKISDEKARELISTVLDKNFFVEAGAGSGKTTSLVNRMVSLVESGVPVDKICTITFTKAAADEFFSRFQDLLSKRSVIKEDDADRFLGPKNERTMSLCQEALNNIDLCFLGTIDSFLNMIAHELPNELGIPNDSDLISNDERQAISNEIYYEILLDKTNPLHKKAVEFNRAFSHAYDTFASCIAEVFENRDAEIVYNHAPINFDEALKDDKEWFKQVVSDFAKDAVGKTKPIKEAIEKLKANNYLISHRNWKDIINVVTDSLKALKKIDKLLPVCATNRIAKYSAISNDEKYAKIDEDFTNRIIKMLTIINEYKYQLCMDLVVSALPLIIERLKDLGKFTFYDYLYYVTDAFKRSASTDRELIIYLFNKHRYILVDESQDTNPLQTQLFFYLTSTVKTDDWTKCEPLEGSLFIVGDPKQAIYCFRGANVSAYTKTKELFAKKDEVLVLSNNYRSNPDLKKWFNDSMNQVLKTKADPLTHEDIPLKAHEDREDIINKEPLILDGVFKYVSDNDPEQVANMINYFVNSKKVKIFPKLSKEPRFVEYKDIMVVPIKVTVDDFIKTFNEYNIPITIEASLPFAESESLMILKDLLYLMKEPSNKIHFLNVISSKLFNLDYQDAILMQNAGFNLNIAEILDVNNEPIKFENERYFKVVNTLHKLYQETMEMTYSSTLIYLLSKLDIFKRVSTRYLEYSYFLIEKVKSGENDGSISSFKQLKDFIESFISSETDDNRCLRFVDEVNRVKIANLHKVKGLQAPIVILAKPSVKNRAPTHYVDYSSGSPKAYFQCINSKKYFNVKDIETTQFNDQIDIWNEFNNAELRRLEYVGATRAESVLIVGNPIKLASDRHNPWGELLSTIKDEIHYEVNDEYKNELVEIKHDSIKFTSDINSICNQKSYEVRSPSQIRTRSSIQKVEDVVDNNPITDETIVGTFVHALMECIANSKNKYDANELVDELLTQYDDVDKYRDLFIKVANEMKDSDIVKTLVNSKNVMCEVPFAYKENNKVINGIIDCIYEDESGWHIIDYKTGKEKDVARLEEHYKDQLDSYKKALKKIKNVDCDAHIVHIDLN